VKFWTADAAEASHVSSSPNNIMLRNAI